MDIDIENLPEPYKLAYNALKNLKTSLNDIGFNFDYSEKVLKQFYLFYLKANEFSFGLALVNKEPAIYVLFNDRKDRSGPPFLFGWGKAKAEGLTDQSIAESFFLILRYSLRIWQKLRINAISVIMTVATRKTRI